MRIIKRGLSLLTKLLLIAIILLLSPVITTASDSNLSIIQIDDSRLPDVSLFVRLDNVVERDSGKLKKDLSIYKPGLRTSYFGFAVIMIPIMLSLVIMLALLWFLLNSKEINDQANTEKNNQNGQNSGI